MEKTFQELDLCNSFLFAAALEDSETCRLVLEIILGRELPRVTVHAEHSILVSADFRSVRLDIYASDEVHVNYNVEAQNWNEGNLAKRSRFHQAEMDVYSLKPGQDFRDLKPSYVIFICTFDPFGQKLYRYTFEERCLERNFALGDETCKIFLNTKGENADEVPEELIHFLSYVEHSTDEYVSQVQEERIARLHRRVATLKQRRELEAQYMTVEEWMRMREREAVEKGTAAGMAQGIEQGIAQGLERGMVQGKAEVVLMLLQDLGCVPDELEQRIRQECEPAVLDKWAKLAARVATIEEFSSQI